MATGELYLSWPVRDVIHMVRRDFMNDALKRFLDETGEEHASSTNRSTSPILFKADDENGGKVLELLPQGEPRPYWRVREREMTPGEVAALIQEKKDRAHMPWAIGAVVPGTNFTVRGYVYNARIPNKWNLSVDGAS